MGFSKREIVQRVQAQAMVRDAALGMNYREIAKKYGVSKDTVMRRLSYYERAQLYTSHEDKILEGMVPLAEKALMQALNREASESFEGKPEIALEVYKGTRLFKRDAGKNPSEMIPGGADTLEAHIARIRDAAAQELETTDAELLPEPQGVAGLIEAPRESSESPVGPSGAVEGADGADGAAPAEAGEGRSTSDGEVRDSGSEQPAGGPGETES